MPRRTSVVIAGAALVAAVVVARRRLVRWGADDAEMAMAVPGDDVVPGAGGRVTMATTLDAPPAAVWPWLVQMGVGRAGWYSFDVLDNAGRASAERIVPELQQIAVGDRLASSTGGATWFDVVGVEPERALVLRAGIDLRARRSFPPGARPAWWWSDGSWAFLLEPAPGGRTRLIVRAQGTGRPFAVVRLGDLMFWNPAHVVMQLRQFAGLRRRVAAAGGGPRLIDDVLPDCDAAIVARRVVRAPADVVFRAALETDLIAASAEDPLIGALFGIRGAVDRAVARVRGQEPPRAPDATMRIGEIPAAGPDWIRLAQTPGRELVFGAVGRFWDTIRWEPTSPEAFADFDQPGFARVVAAISVVPRGPAETLLVYETRTRATDPGARRSFLRYWRVVAPGVAIVMRRTARWMALAAERDAGA